jgi:hypothetical protein
MTSNPNEGAATLAEIVQDEFQFLAERGFHCVVEDASSIRYERDDGVFVRVFRDQRDKYVGFRIGLTSRPRDALTATELAKLSGVAEPRGEFPERFNQLRASVARVAHDLRTHGEPRSVATRRSTTKPWSCAAPTRSGTPVHPTDHRTGDGEDVAQ